MAEFESIEDATRAVPWQRSGGLILAWEPGQTPRKGITAFGQTCPDPHCPCRKVVLEIQEVQEGLLRVEREGAEVRLEYAEPAPAEAGLQLKALLDLESGYVEAQSPDAPALHRRFQALCDASLLAEYRELWKQMKGGAGQTWENADWSFLEDSTMVPWDLISEMDPDFFEVEARHYAVPEYFCGERDCRCRRALVEVVRLERKPSLAEQSGRHEVIGTFRLELDACTATDFELEPGLPSADAAALKKVADAYLARHPDLDRARRRHARVREIGPRILDLANEQMLGARVEPVRNAPQPSPNDRCPCGSGKKYKRCCGAAR
ncbi:MAG: SEC-C metal-binding domain-containing protein [Myxococcales bacterium]